MRRKCVSKKERERKRMRERKNCEKGRKRAKDIIEKKEKALGKKESEVHDGIG